VRNLALVTFLAAIPMMGQTYTISTFAGGGPNNVSATILPVGNIGGVVNDTSGNCYFSSINLNRVFRVNNGILFVVAGSGLAGSSGDGGPAAAASLSGPTFLSLDNSGNLYITDAGNNRVRRMNLSSGVINNFAGTGVAGALGDGSSATGAQLSAPRQVATDLSGNVYIADSGNNKIRLVNSSSGIITTFAGTGTAGALGDGGSASAAQFNAPSGLAFDAVNNLLYISDTGNNRVRRISLGNNNVIQTVVNQTPGTAGFSGNGNSALTAQVNSPQGLALDGTGNMFIADSGNQQIRRVAISSGQIGNISTAAGNGQVAPPLGNGGPASAARLNFPTAVSVDSSSILYIADQLDGMVRTVASPYGSSATINVIAGNGVAITPVTFFGDNGLASNAVLTNPFEAAVSADGSTVILADQNDNIVRSVNLTTGIITTIAGTGTQGALGDGGAATSAQLNQPHGVALDSSNNLYIADFGNNKIRKVSAATGNISTYAGTGTAGYNMMQDSGPATNALMNGPIGLAFDGSNNLFVSEFNNNCIRRIAGDTQIITTVIGNCALAGTEAGDGLPPTNAAVRLFGPEGIAVNSTATVIYFADSVNNRVRWVNNALLNTYAGTTLGFSDGVPANQAQLSFPSGVVLDAQGNLLIGDANNNRVRRVAGGNPNNTITTVAGDNTAGFGGDGGSATSAELDHPLGLAINPVSGAIYVNDFFNNRVRQLSVVCTYTLTPTSNLNAPATAGNYSITVTTNPATGCPYTASVPSGVGYLSITSGASGNGSGTVNYSVQANTSGSTRSTTLTVAGQSFGFSQLAAVCTYTLNPTSNLNAPSTAANYAITVTTNPATGCPYTASAPAGVSYLNITSGAGGNGSGTVNYSLQANTSGSTRSTTLTVAGQSFNVSQLSLSVPGVKAALFQNVPGTGGFYFIDRNNNHKYDGPPGDSEIGWGGAGVTPVVGDWNGDGSSKVGLYYQGFWYLDYNGDGVFESGTDKVYYFGNASCTPIVGDWNGSGTTKIGIYCGGSFILDNNGDGIYEAGTDEYFGFGPTSAAQPLVGDWNASGTSKVGVFQNGFFLLDINGDRSSVKLVGWGQANGIPVVGDWNGSGSTKIGSYSPGGNNPYPGSPGVGQFVLDVNGDYTYTPGTDALFPWGDSLSVPVVGDWNGDGRSKIGVVSNGIWVLDMNGNFMYDLPAEQPFQFGGCGTATPNSCGQTPVPGHWQ
jgi:sugar lactone lactonase YvrE